MSRVLIISMLLMTPALALEDPDPNNSRWRIWNQRVPQIASYDEMNGSTTIRDGNIVATGVLLPFSLKSYRINPAALPRKR